MPDKNLLKAIIKGAFTFFPGVSFFYRKRKKKSNHSGASAHFCYTFWLSMLIYFKEKGIMPCTERIGELGNGGSFGIGMCAILSGTKEYFALEIEEVFNEEQNIQILEELVLLFKNKTPITYTYDVINFKIHSREFPEDLIIPIYLKNDVIDNIKADIKSRFINSREIKFIKNWHEKTSLNLDFIFSRAVLEHVENLESVYHAIYHHLKPNSLMFHDVEFHSHGVTKSLDGHYNLNPMLWKIIYGRREYFLNRCLPETHLKYISELGFDILDYFENKNNEKSIQGTAILAKKL